MRVHRVELRPPPARHRPDRLGPQFRRPHLRRQPRQPRGRGREPPAVQRSSRATSPTATQVRAAMGKGVTDVIHFAAESHVDRSIQDSGPFVRTNVIGTQILLDAAREFKAWQEVRAGFDRRGVRQPRRRPGCSPRKRRSTRTARTPRARPAADMLVKAYQHTFGMNAVITRCSNNYGPYQFPEKLIPLFVTNIMNDEAGAGVRRRPAGPRLDSRAGPLHRRRSGVAEGASPARCTTSAGGARSTNLDLTHLLEAPRQAEDADQVREGPPRPRPPLRHRLREGRARVGLDAEVDVRARPPAETIDWYKANGAWVAGSRTKTT